MMREPDDEGDAQREHEHHCFSLHITQWHMI